MRPGAADFDHLLRALVDQWPAYLAYVTSFLTVGSVWIAHHDLYGLAILAGIFIFPKLAAAAYLLVAIRGVLVIGGEGRLSLGGLSRG